MNLKGLQEIIEKIGEGLPPKDDWMPALIVENDESASVFGFVGDCMGSQQSKDMVAQQIIKCIVEFKPHCACFITTAWLADLEKEDLSEFEMELWRAGVNKISDYPKRIEIVNAYYYGVRGPDKEEALMIGYIQRYPDAGPKIKKWKIIREGASAEGRFPDAVKEGFQLSGLTKED